MPLAVMTGTLTQNELTKKELSFLYDLLTFRTQELIRATSLKVCSWKLRDRNREVIEIQKAINKKTLA